MERIKELNRYQRVILVLLAVMLALFTVLYVVTFSRVGYAFGGYIFVPGETDGSTTYSARIWGQDAVFTVTDQTVTLHYGEKTYGPYTVRDDPTAIPDDSQMASSMIGVEIREGDRIFFRGGVFNSSGGLVTVNEDGSLGSFAISYSLGDGVERDQYGNPIDPMKPTATTILELLWGPKLTCRGQWGAWLAGVVISAATVVSILFADELFWWKMSFRVSDPDNVYPSDWEIAGRYISWTALPVMALIVYVIGLFCVN